MKCKISNSGTIILVKCSLLFILLILFGQKPIKAQEKTSLGLSSQIHSTRLMVNGVIVRSKRAYRISSVVFLEHKFRKKLAIHTGLGYSLMSPQSEIVKNDFHYLTMPLYLKYGRIKEGKKFGFKFFYGPNFRYLVKTGHAFFNGEKVNNVDHVRKIQWDFDFGGGMGYRLSNKLYLEAMPSFSIGSMMNKANLASMVVRKINTNLMLNLSYKIK